MGQFEKPTAQADGGVASCSESSRTQVRCGSCARGALPSTRSLQFFKLPYGISPAFWRRGYAQWGLSELLQLVKCAGTVSRVLASISPVNVASCSLVAKLGFVRGAEFSDSDGEQVHSWSWKCHS